MGTHAIIANIPDELYRRLGKTIQMEPGASMSGVIEQALEGYLAQRAWRHQRTLTALEQAAGGCLLDDQEMDRWMTANFGPDPGKAEPGA